MDKIVELLIQNFLPLLNQIWNSQTFWRGLSLLLLLAAFSGWNYRQKIAEFALSNKEHDLRIFKESNEIFNETQLMDIVDYELLSNHSIEHDHYRQLTRWSRFFEEVGNQYLDARLIKQSQSLLKDLDELNKYIAGNFFYLRGQDSSNKNEYLYPDLNIDRGGSTAEDMKKYSKYASELEDLTRKVGRQYSQYRLVIKKILKV
ncbi:MAG: hypothetical protein HZB50_04775 [Chloroflexi bacterium]|nr:hypothetical protein [Chloroflexota bacterium]